LLLLMCNLKGNLRFRTHYLVVKDLCYLDINSRLRAQAFLATDNLKFIQIASCRKPGNWQL